MSLFIFLAVLVWVVSIGAWWFVSKTMRNADVDRLKSRLVGNPKAKEKKATGKPAPRLIEAEDLSTGKYVMRLLQRFELRHHLERLLEQSGLKWKPARLIHASLMAGLAGFLAAWYGAPVELRPLAILPAALCAAAPILHVVRKRTLRLRRFEELFPESLEFVARSMRAGHAFSVSLEMIYREFQEPLAGEFRRTFEEHNLGLPLDTALEKLAKRVPSMDVHFFVSAVLLQKRTGGNLAEILDKLAYVIRERFKLRGKIRAISAHGRMTGVALTCIPAGVGLIMFYVNPDYIKFFFDDTTGQIMLGAAVALQAVGYAIIKKIVTIEV